jgi:hypothetical protein
MTRHGRSTLLTAPRAVRRFFVRHRLLACFSRPEKSGPRCFEQQHKSNKAMEATKSHVQARKHKCDDQLIIKCWFHKFRIEGRWNQSNYEFEMLVWRCTNLPTAEAKPEYVNAKAVQATGFQKQWQPSKSHDLYRHRMGQPSPTHHLMSNENTSQLPASSLKPQVSLILVLKKLACHTWWPVMA